MWQFTFQDRLREWSILRDQCIDQDLETCLHSINDWWFASPWRPYYLHWDDLRTWPGPWDLLADNIFCDLARSLGIVYTILMLERPDIADVGIANTDDGNNLVLVNGGKYILNWEPGDLLNIDSANITITKSLDSSKLEHLLG